MGDTLFYNGAIYTMNGDYPEAEALLVRDDRILYVGTLSEAEKMAAADVLRYDLRGRMLLPGFIDAHCHPSLCAFFSSGILLSVDMTREEVEDAVKEYIDRHPERETYFGIGYPEVAYDEKGPRKEVLDAMCPDKPVMILGSGGHEGWCNSKTFELAGITKETPDPVPGFQYFERDEDGQPTGHLVETDVQEMIFGKINFFDQEILGQSYLDAFDDYCRAGVTTLADCGAMKYMEGVSIPFFQQYYADGENCRLRVSGCAFTGSADDLEDNFKRLRERRDKYAGDLYKVDTYKLILDGTIESRSASMMEPYVEDGSVVAPLLEGKELQDLFVRAASEGFDIHCHAIGDRAIHEVLMAAKAVREAGYDDIRITNAHTEYVLEEDASLFGKYDVIANTTGVWHYGGKPNKGNIISEKASDPFYMKPIIDHGAKVSLGSDRPVDLYGYEPLKSIEMAMTRKMYGVEDAPELEPEGGGMTLQQCLESYTSSAAYQLHMEDKIGTLEAGKYADLTMLEKDLFSVDPRRIHEVKIEMTMMNGKITYER